MPRNTSPNPRTIKPYCRHSSRLAENETKNPSARIGRATSVTLNASICAVTVVPIFAPRMTATLCDVDIKPAEMNPTNSTVVIEDDWIMAVTAAPVAIPRNRLLVILASSTLMKSPTTILSARVRMSRPNRNSASPPTSPAVSSNPFSPAFIPSALARATLQ